MPKIKSEFEGRMFGRKIKTSLKIELTPFESDSPKYLNAQLMIDILTLYWEDKDDGDILGSNITGMSDDGFTAELLKNMKEDTDAS